MKKFQIVSLRDNTRVSMLRDYTYNPNDPDVKDHYTRKGRWNVIPEADRAWLYTYMQDRTPRGVFSENSITPQKAVSLLNQFPQWIKNDRAFKVMVNDLAQLNNASQLYNVLRYFKDHYLIHSIELKYGTFDGTLNNDEQRAARSENAFNEWYGNFVAGWQVDKGGFWGTILDIVQIPLNYLSGGLWNTAKDVVSGAGDVADVLETLSGVRAPNGETLYYPDFTKDLNAQYIPDGSGYNPNVNKAGLGSIGMLLIGGLALSMIFGSKKRK